MAARVSVVIPAYNAGTFLRPAVLSALAVPLDGVEALVVDDGSTDGSLSSISGLPVRVVRQEHLGVSAARNAGVRACAGAFVTLLDGDDLLSPQGLAPRLDYLETHAEARAVGGLPSALIDERGSRLAEVFERMRAKLAFPLTLTRDYYRAAGFFPVQLSLYLFRRETFDRVGLFDETLPAGEDADFLFRLLALAEIEILPVPACERRLHSSNLSMAGAPPGTYSFRAETLDAIRRVNERHGMKPSAVAPWELEYL